MARPKDPTRWIIVNCPTCKNDFETRISRTRTFCTKKCASSNEGIKEKNRQNVKATFDTKYGCHPMQLENTKNILKHTLLDKYGVEHYSQHKDWKLQIENTKTVRYGDPNYHNIELCKKTCLAKYGVEHYKNSEDWKKKYKQTCLNKYDEVHASTGDKFKESHKNAMFNKFLLNENFKNFCPLFSINEYTGVTGENTKYKFKCIRCDNEEMQDLTNGRRPKCFKCDRQIVSGFQFEIFDYISSITKDTEIYQNDRTIIYPKEIDIYIPSKKLGIECDGLYWHSEVLGKKHKMYHLHKTNNLLLKEIRLIHIFESEWNFKQDIVKSILNSILDTDDIKRIHARKCKIVELTSKTSNEFLEKNHLQGKSTTSYCIGLEYENELVSVMTFIKSRFDKSIEWELVRFANKLNCTIIGGASKLFNYFKTKKTPTSVLSYCDRRYFTGTVYMNLGFSFLNNTPPGYHYIFGKYKYLENRISWMKGKLKDKLAIFDETLSEWENMKTNGHDRIWDCGNMKWIWSASA